MTAHEAFGFLLFVVFIAMLHVVLWQVGFFQWVGM
jgi:hypothetical protein